MGEQHDFRSYSVYMHLNTEASLKMLSGYLLQYSYSLETNGK